MEVVKVTVELLPFGRESDKKLLGTIIIGNDSTGTMKIGNYNYLVTDGSEQIAQGKILGFDRRHTSVMELIRLTLEDWHNNEQV